MLAKLIHTLLGVQKIKKESQTKLGLPPPDGSKKEVLIFNEELVRIIKRIFSKKINNKTV